MSDTKNVIQTDKTFCSSEYEHQILKSLYQKYLDMKAEPLIQMKDEQNKTIALAGQRPMISGNTSRYNDIYLGRECKRQEDIMRPENQKWLRPLLLRGKILSLTCRFYPMCLWCPCENRLKHSVG